MEGTRWPYMHTTSCRWKCGIIICHTPGAHEGRGISFIRVCALSDRRLPEFRIAARVLSVSVLTLVSCEDFHLSECDSWDMHVECDLKLRLCGERLTPLLLLSLGGG